MHTNDTALPTIRENFDQERPALECVTADTNEALSTEAQAAVDVQSDSTLALSYLETQSIRSVETIQESNSPRSIGQTSAVYGDEPEVSEHYFILISLIARFCVALSDTITVLAVKILQRLHPMVPTTMLAHLFAAVKGGWSECEVYKLGDALTEHFSIKWIERQEDFKNIFGDLQTLNQLTIAKYPQDRESAAAGTSLLSRLFGLELTQFVRFGNDPLQYLMRFPSDRSITLSHRELTTAVLLQTRIANSVGITIPKFESDEWAMVTKLLLFGCEWRDVADEETDRGETIEWIREYLDSRNINTVETSDQFADCVQKRGAFSRNGVIYFFLMPFKTWLEVKKRVNLGRKDLGKRLREAGIEYKPLPTVTDGGKPSTISAWGIRL